MSFPVLDEHRLAATDAATLRLMNGRTTAWAQLDDIEELRDRAHAIRMQAIDDLDGHRDRFIAALEAAGGTAHVCATAEEARETVTRICVEAGAKLAAKSKSMLSEEIELNGALEAAGIEVVETDLGEYILQLAGEHPVHIIAPAIAKTAGDVAALLSAVDGAPVEAGAESARAGRAATAPPRVRTSRRRHHRRELRRLRHGLDLFRHERGQRRPRHRAAAQCTSRSSGWSGSCRRSTTSRVLLQLSRAAARGRR